MSQFKLNPNAPVWNPLEQQSQRQTYQTQIHSSQNVHYYNAQPQPYSILLITNIMSSTSISTTINMSTN